MLILSYLKRTIQRRHNRKQITNYTTEIDSRTEIKKYYTSLKYTVRKMKSEIEKASILHE